MSRIYFTSDTHFGQQRTLELSRRPFHTTVQMDQEIVNNWRMIVDDDDIVYHLGDFGDPEVVHELSGAEINILPGNYDTPEVLERLQRDPRITVLGEPYLLQAPASYGLPDLWMVHEPENAIDPNDFYLYGHIHQLQMVKRNGLNVGVDCHRFMPIDFADIKFYYDAITKHYDENVFIERLGYADG